MDSSVMQCIQMRIDFFEKYYSVPEQLKPEVDAFIEEMKSLGEQSFDAQDFEAKFAMSGFQDRLNSLIMRCTPKPYKMTEEEKAASKATAQQIFEEDRERIRKEGVEEAVDYAAVMAEEEFSALKRQAMIETGVYDEYTRASNAIDIAKNAGGFLGKIFKKKK